MPELTLLLSMAFIAAAAFFSKDWGNHLAVVAVWLLVMAIYVRGML